MGALDFVSKVLTIYEARTDDHIGELKKLKKNITDTQKAELEGHEARGAQYEGWKKSLTEVNSGLELVGKAVAVGREAFKAFSDDLRLRAAAGTTSIEGLRSASLGLRTEHELLAFAAKAQGAAFKLTQGEMETTQRAMVALTRAGFDQEQVTQKVTDAIVKLEGDGLKDFGIRVKQGSTDTEKFANVMAALAEKAQGVNSNTLTAAESVAKMGVTMGDSIDHMKQSLGELVVAMAPLLNALAKGVSLIAAVVSSTGSPTPQKVQAAVRADIMRNPGGNWAFLYKAAHGGKLPEGAGATPTRAADQWGAGNGSGTFDETTWLSQQQGMSSFLTGLDPFKTPDGSFDEGTALSFLRKRGLMPDQRTDTAGSLSWGKWGGAGAAGASGDFIGSATGRLGGAFKAAVGAVDDSEAANWKKNEKSIMGADELRAAGGMPTHEMFEEMKVDLEKLQASIKPGPTILERLGLHDPSAFEMATNVLQTFTATYASSMQAIGESSMSGADIAKHAFAEVIRGIGGQLAAKGAAEAVEGAALLFTGNPLGAAHLGAAALYSGGSIAAYAAASKIDGKGGGKGGGSSGGGASGGGSTIGGSVSSKAQDQAESNKARAPQIFILGSAFDNSTPRERARLAQQTWEKAKREQDE